MVQIKHFLLCAFLTHAAKGEKDNGITRSFIGDTVEIRGASLVKAAEENGELCRFAEVAPNLEDLPFILRQYFPRSRIYDKVGGLFLPMTGDKDPFYAPCRKLLERKFKPASFDISPYVKQAADALEQNKSDKELEAAFVRGLMNRFCPHGKDIPDNIIKNCRSQLNEPTEALNPVKRVRAKRNVPKVYRFFEDAIKDEGLPKERTVTTVGHGAFSAQFHGAPILKQLYKDPTQNVERMFADMVRVKSVGRMVKKDTTFGGILKKPAVAGKTIIKLDLINASKETRDHAWSFGRGTNYRRCLAEPAILEFVKAVKAELLARKK